MLDWEAAEENLRCNLEGTPPYRFFADREMMVTETHSLEWRTRRPLPTEAAGYVRTLDLAPPPAPHRAGLADAGVTGNPVAEPSPEPPPTRDDTDPTPLIAHCIGIGWLLLGYLSPDRVWQAWVSGTSFHEGGT